MEKNLVVENVIDIVREDNQTEHLLARLKDNFHVIVFGGAVRDVLFGYEKNIRDIDFVLYPRKCIGDREQEDLLKEIIQVEFKSRVGQNQFGGYKIGSGRTTLDLWLLKDTWAFKHNLLEATPENLLKSVYLNIDAYALDYFSGEFIARCNQRRNRVIDIVLEKSACEELNLLRAVVFQKKYNMRLSNRITEKLDIMLQHWQMIETQIYEIEKRHYGEVLVTRKDIEDAVKGV